MNILSLISWIRKKLPEVMFIQEGPGIRKYEYEDGGYPMINVRCVQNGYIDMSKSKSANYELATNKWKHFQVDEGDILYTISGTIGRSAIVKRSDLPLLMNTSVVRFKSLTPDLDAKFAYYYFKTDSFINELLGHSTGTAIKNVGPSHLKKMDISYPIISEQKRIVAILDQVFADIEQARAKTEQNLKNARELFESYLQQVFSQRGEGWVKTTLGSIAEFKNGLNFSQSSKGEKVKIVGVKDFKSNFMVPFEQLEEIQIDGALSESYELKENDIITVRSNGNRRLIGRCLLMGVTNSKTSYSGFTIRIRVISEVVDSHFLTYYLRSATTHELLVGAGGGANISNLNQKILTSLPVVFPNLETQNQLTSDIKRVELETAALTQIYERKLNSLDNLKKSILQKAFTGELTRADKKSESKGVIA